MEVLRLRRAILATGAGFSALIALCLFFEQFWILLLPIAAAIVALALFRLDVLFMLITALTPLSVAFEDLPGGFGLALPTEPLMFGLMLVFLLKFFFDGQLDRRLLTHPMSVVLLLQMAWLVLTTFTSTEPLVSVKYLLSRLWFVIGFFYVAVLVFKNVHRIRLFIWLYLIPLCFVAIYTIAWHSTFAFAEKPAHWVMQPFFKDHTSYGAILAMFYPLTWAFLFSNNLKPTTKVVVAVVMALLTAAIILSYTRAAWVSLAGALLIFIAVKIQLRPWIAAVLLAAGGAGYVAFQEQVTMELEKNRQDSSDDLAEHVSSISNVATDASNLERINRWNAAWRMFQDKPVFGFGPGTYKFHYAPYQHSSQLTIISTNFGDLGNAHSEYFGSLAEGGVLGFLLVIALFGVAYWTCWRTVNRVKNRELQLLSMGSFLGLCTYMIHGSLNNYLDLDKANVPFWGFIAINVAIELYHANKLEEETAY